MNKGFDGIGVVITGIFDKKLCCSDGSKEDFKGIYSVKEMEVGIRGKFENPFGSKCLVTSKILDIKLDGRLIMVETKNSIYIMEVVR